MATLKFCGAAGTVTGSCSHIHSESSTFLVDCGLFQGNRTTQELNLVPFPFDATKVEFLVLTHAHIDHSGLLPKLTKAGFTGPIYTTPATKDLLEFMLLDSAYIQESNAERQNKKNERRGEPAVEPIYTIEDAKHVLKQIKTHEYEAWFEPSTDVRVRFWNAGHLLGSLSAEIQVTENNKAIRLLFSGDLGPDEKAFHPEPDAPAGYDYIICESTYGNRDREEYTLVQRREAMKNELNRAFKKGGNVVIPSFAVERSQELLHDIAVLLNSGEIPNAQVYLDSPMASKATEVFIKYANTMEDIEIKPSELFRHKNFHIVESVQESKSINNVKSGAIIISASGMCTAGRIKHHLKNNIYRPECTILFVGYQSPGTLGQIITSGVKAVRIHGKEYKVRAEIRRLGNYSAHADQPELLDWLVERGPVTGGLFLNHGEDDGRTVLADLAAKKGYDRTKIYLPQFDESYELVAGGPPTSIERPEPRFDVTQIERDWHNDYAAFMMNLSNKLQATETAHDRQALISRLSEALN
ncbi:MBL fold metallo-hydrolase RNA specificity domain-containing protein [Rubripirellula reticaptiva]|uniref:Ribonuclease n=1 Tax=Rubripirellula reticaptiva TaxID=2528013 RepID=A0A5C6ELP3_9BACT|nr:MBL fold metallo-hydrolase [Rubripirellula reticaptiva]TWU49778.1 Ribonuclease [Rubripirellula reticaptiva]